MSSAPLRLCIVNGYPKASRENFERQGVTHPHELFRAVLARRAPNATTDLLFIADPDGRPPAGAAIADYDGFLWTGSDMTVYKADDPRVARQIEFARAAFDSGVPAYGSCWGLQVSAVAAGGEARACPKGREFCFARGITRTEAGRGSRLLAGKPDRYDAFIMHLDEVCRLPPGARLLAENAHSGVQAAEIRHGKGEFWSAQYHPEYNLLEMARLVAARAEPLVREGFFKDAEGVRAFAEKLKALHASPGDAALRAELKVGEDILDGELREAELRNWLAFVAARRN